VIVRRDGDGWALIRQVDHSAHCGRLARAWRDGPFGRDSVSASLEHAATHHDVGWTDNDLKPEIDRKACFIDHLSRIWVEDECFLRDNLRPLPQ